jgi:hypothetical protein
MISLAVWWGLSPEKIKTREKNKKGNCKQTALVCFYVAGKKLKHASGKI